VCLVFGGQQHRSKAGHATGQARAGGTRLDVADDVVAEAGGGADNQEGGQADQQAQHRAEADRNGGRGRHVVPAARAATPLLSPPMSFA
jgi:hypothetical protein